MLIFWSRLYNFYPRPRVEGDIRTTEKSPSTVNFYPRPRVEGDIMDELDSNYLSNFYPRPRVEGDDWNSGYRNSGD